MARAAIIKPHTTAITFNTEYISMAATNMREGLRSRR